MAEDRDLVISRHLVGLLRTTPAGVLKGIVGTELPECISRFCFLGEETVKIFSLEPAHQNKKLWFAESLLVLFCFCFFFFFLRLLCS